MDDYFKWSLFSNFLDFLDCIPHYTHHVPRCIFFLIKFDIKKKGPVLMYVCPTFGFSKDNLGSIIYKDGENEDDVVHKIRVGQRK